MNNLRKFEHILNEGISQEDLADTLCHRIEMRYPDIYKKYDYDAMYNAVDDVASFHAGAEELGSRDISMMIRQVFKRLEESEGVAEGQLDELKCWDGYKRVPGTTAGAPGSCEKIKEEDLNELSTDRLAKYKTAAGADARAADKAGDFARGNKRFAGIVKATKKQFDNETKPKKESAIMKGIQNETLGTPYPGTYEQEYGPFKRKGQERTMKIAFEGKKNVRR